MVPSWTVIIRVSMGFLTTIPSWSVVNCLIFKIPYSHLFVCAFTFHCLFPFVPSVFLHSFIFLCLASLSFILPLFTTTPLISSSRHNRQLYHTSAFGLAKALRLPCRYTLRPRRAAAPLLPWPPRTAASHRVSCAAITACCIILHANAVTGSSLPSARSAANNLNRDCDPRC